MCPETFFEICTHWLMRLFLESSFGGIRSYVGILYVNFPTVGGEKFHELSVMGENLLHNVYGYCCNGWCWILMGDNVFHICLVLKFGGKAVYNVFNEGGLSVASLL